jgi:hypothetical protein
MLRVTTFSTVKEAKDFLAGRIAAEAAHENVPLSEVERKMLYFSETDWTLPDMNKVSAEFDRDYDQNEYEQKIARLIVNIAADRHRENEAEREEWDAAVEKLSDGDHYLSVLIGEADRRRGPLSMRDFLKASPIAFVLISTLLVLGALINWLFATEFWRERVLAASDRDKWLSAALILVVGYFLVPKLWQIIRMRSSRP